MEELLSLKWNNHRSTFLHILSILRDKQLYTDATLACNGKFYSVHRLVLSTCSDYFSAMFDRTTTCKNPIIVLKDIKCEDLEALLDYMYLGEVNVRQTELASLIKAAECLQVKGLAVPDDEPPSSKRSKSDNSNVRRPSDGQISPASKRKKRSTIEAPLDRDSSSQSKSPQTQTRLPSDDPVNNDKEAVVNNDNDLPLETFVKVEKDDDILIEDDPQQFNPDGGGIKGEMDDGDPMNEIGGDSLDFLQSADEDYSQPYPGPSYQADLQNWQGDPPVSGADFTGMNFPSQSQDGSQNSTGIMDYLHSSRGGFKLLFGEYIYVIDRKNGNTSYWRCERRGKCGGRIKTFNGIVQGQATSHSHMPDLDRIKQLKAEQELRMNFMLEGEYLGNHN